MPESVNPANGEHIASYPVLQGEALETVLSTGKAAATTWQTTEFAERAALLRAVADQLRNNRDTFTDLMTREMGKPVREGRGEVDKAAWCAEHYAEHGEGYLRKIVLPSDATRSYVQHLPLGMVLGILPWNAPLWLAFRFCAPALMAGNTCLMKHDLHVQGCARMIEAAFAAAGAPAGVFRNLPVDNHAVADIIRDPRVSAVSFTGSSRAGALVAAAAGAAIKPAVLELGGSDPAIVLQDAPLEKAVETIALSRIINAGQSCIAAKRIIVEAPVYDDFIRKLHHRLEQLQVGDPALESTDVGPLARQDLRDNLHRQVQATRDAGARCLMGGQLPDGPGFFYPVTLLVDVTNEMPAAREETFGPVAVVLHARDADQALQLANDSAYGLAGSIWTDTRRGEALAARMEAGQVAVNGLVKTDPRLPSGGIKQSGIGRELGPHGILEFVNVQQVWVGPRVE